MTHHLHRNLVLVLFLTPFLLGGCGKGSKTKIEVKNYSDRPISMLHISDLVHSIDPIVNLKPARIVTTETPQQDIPEAFTITWNYKSGPNSQNPKRSKLSLRKIPNSQRKGKFILEFTKDYQWVARFEQSSP